MMELLLLLIGIIGSFAAGLYDLKTSNVPDKVCITMIILGISIHTINGFLTNDFSNLFQSLFFGSLFTLFGVGMYLLGWWGGGDGELLVAISILLPNMTLAKTYFPFAISFFINSFLVGAVYSIIYSMILAYKNPRISRTFFNSLKGSSSSLLLLLFPVLVLLITNQYFLSLLFFLVFLLFILEKFSKAVEKGFYKRIPTTKLKVDDMIGEDIPKLGIYKRFIRGLKKEEVKKIKRMKKYVTIREGIRYGMVFPITLILTLFFGDIFLFLF
jgi:Flp pilus assembly protein protease CpaA